jgi:chromosome segregation ATPase
VRWLTGGKERELEKQREHMIQEVIKRHQQAMADLADDINTIAAKLEEYTSQSDRNEARLAQLEAELSTFRSALGALRDQKQRHAS